MRRRPPRSTLVPYTTLFRSRGHVRHRGTIYRRGATHRRGGTLGGGERRDRLAVAPGGRLLRGALQEAGAEKTERQGAAQEEAGPAARETARLFDHLVYLGLAQVAGEPLDLIGRLVRVLGDRRLALLAQLLGGLPERHLYGRQPLGGLVLLVGQLGLDLLAAPGRKLPRLLPGLLGYLLPLLLDLFLDLAEIGRASCRERV